MERSRKNFSSISRGGSFAAVVESLLDEGIGVRFRAGGRSMSPAVRDGETVVVAPLDSTAIVVGDVVYGRGPRGPVAHRVVTIARARDGQLRFTLSGDAAADHDRPIAGADLRGKVVGVERRGGLVPLTVLGGALGRHAFVAALEVRRSFRALAKRIVAAALTPAGASR